MTPESADGQASALLMSPALTRLLEDHRALGEVIMAFEVRLDRLTQRDPETLDLLASLVDYVAEYPGRVHHPREERIIDRLVDKGLTPGERVVVEVTVRQHAELASATAQLESDIDALLARQRDAGVHFDHDIRAYLALQKEHMRREEQQLFPMAVRLFSKADWRDIEAAEPDDPDPMMESRLERYANLLALVDSHRSQGTLLDRK